MVGYTPTLEEMVNYLDIYAYDLKINLKVRGDFRGFPKDYLEEKVVNFATSNNWDSLDTIMVLLIFGLILFPSEENFLDLIAVNVFLAVKIGDEDPTHALLEDVYYTFHQRYVKKGGYNAMLCSSALQMVYLPHSTGYVYR